MPPKRRQNNVSIQFDSTPPTSNKKPPIFQRCTSEIYRCVKTLVVFTMLLVTGCVFTGITTNANRQLADPLTVLEIETCLVDLDESRKSLDKSFDKIHESLDRMSMHTLKVIQKLENESTEIEGRTGSSRWYDSISHSEEEKTEIDQYDYEKLDKIIPIGIKKPKLNNRTISKLANKPGKYRFFRDNTYKSRPKAVNPVINLLDEIEYYREVDKEMKGEVVNEDFSEIVDDEKYFIANPEPMESESVKGGRDEVRNLNFTGDDLDFICRNNCAGRDYS